MEKPWTTRFASPHIHYIGARHRVARSTPHNTLKACGKMHKLWVALAVCALASCVQGISSGDAPFFLRSRATKNHLTKEAAADKVSSLPGWGNLQDDEFDIYSG